jgi:ABC-type Fe3+ transport system substrate-binding protein
MRMETYRRMKRASLLVLGILLIVALAAYGGRFLPRQLATPTSIVTPALLAGVAYAAEVFGQSHDEIVKRAVRETASQAMEWCSSAREDAEKVAAAAFRKRYPKVQIQWTRCAQPSHEYLLKHLQGGVVQYDLFPINNTTDMPVFLKAGVLETGIRLKSLGFPPEFHTGDIPTDYVGDSGVVRDVGFSEMIKIVGPVLLYNKSKVSANRAPKKLQDCADPYWSGRFAAAAKPTDPSALGLPEFWGKPAMVNWLKKLAANKPIWTRNDTEARSRLIAGEVPLLCPTRFDNAFPDSVTSENLTLVIPDDLGRKVAATEGNFFVIAKGTHAPNAALLAAVFMASRLAQEVLLTDPAARLRVSPSVPGSPQAKALAGYQIINTDRKPPSVMADLQEAVKEAEGLPTTR